MLFMVWKFTALPPAYALNTSISIAFLSHHMVQFVNTELCLYNICEYRSKYCKTNHISSNTCSIKGTHVGRNVQMAELGFQRSPQSARIASPSRWGVRSLANTPLASFAGFRYFLFRLECRSFSINYRTL